MPLEGQKELKTIIETKEKYRRNNIKRTPRNKKGLTRKQQELADLEMQVKRLRQEGLSMQKMADRLGINKIKVLRLFK